MSEVILQLNKEERLISTEQNQSIMQAALTAGIQLFHSCLKGQCGSCRAYLVHGEVDMRTNASLFDEEIQQGQILLCQSFPLTETVTVKPIRQPRV